MSIKVQAFYLDGTTAGAVVGAKAQIAFERQYNTSYVFLFDKQTSRTEWVYYVTWAALKAAGEKVDDDFDTWAATVEDAGLADADGEDKADKPANPTRKDRSRATSSA